MRLWGKDGSISASLGPKNASCTADIMISRVHIFWEMHCNPLTVICAQAICSRVSLSSRSLDICWTSTLRSAAVVWQIDSSIEIAMTLLARNSECRASTWGLNRRSAFFWENPRKPWTLSGRMRLYWIRILYCSCDQLQNVKDYCYGLSVRERIHHLKFKFFWRLESIPRHFH